MRSRAIGLAMAGAVLAAAAIMPSMALATNPCTNASTWWTASNTGARYITPPGGTTGQIYAQFNSTWKVVDQFVNLCYSVAGTSRAAWTGSVPFNANKVKLVDEWHVDGLSITLGYPSGVGFSGSGTTISWTTTASNTWWNNHSFVDVWFKALIAYGWWEQATGYFTFGSSSYNVVAFAQK